MEQMYLAATAGVASHRRVVPSWLPAARTPPRGLNATENTVPDGPVSDPRLLGMAGSAMLTGDLQITRYG
jgi:hypothetical protein